MNNLSSQQRKLVYLGGIVLLLIPTILLGRPSSGKKDANGQAEDPGGILAQQRAEYELGESTLGNVDPSSAAMNLVLLGMRGIAVNQLWMQHDEMKKVKAWGEMRALANSIITLQPHFLDVWRYHGWDLAYNVSSQWDAVEDRYFWVKEGTKFTKDGQQRNQKFPELAWDVGRLIGHKIGRSDEWRFFRQFFLSDPDPKFEGGVDPEMNDRGRDNYLASRDWFLEANRIDSLPGIRQRLMAPMLFRHYPSRSYFDYADARQREGKFTDKTATAWSLAYQDWIERFGREEFETSAGKMYLESTSDEMRALAKQEGIPPEEKVSRWRFYQNLTNYRYWRERAKLESDPEMNDAHQEMYEGRLAFKRGELVYGPDGTPPESVQKLESGMKKFSNMLKKASEEQADYEDKELREANKYDLAEDRNLVEEGMLALIYWRRALEQNNRDIPKEYPLKWLWDREQDSMGEYLQEFERASSSR